jgi:hypothetical protein
MRDVHQGLGKLLGGPDEEELSGACFTAELQPTCNPTLARASLFVPGKRAGGGRKLDGEASRTERGGHGVSGGGGGEGGGEGGGKGGGGRYCVVSVA